jgi:hypothetical protein
MKIILDKCKHEQIEAFENIKKLGKIIFKCTTNLYITSYTYNIIHTIIPFKKIISIYKHMSTIR